MKTKIISYLALGSLLFGTACHRPPSTATSAGVASPSPADSAPANLFKRIAQGAEPPKVNAHQLMPYLAQNHRSALGLLAAFRASGDELFLQEAMRTQPDDARVIFAALTRNGNTPEEQRRWLAAFKKSSPDNALANYFGALDYFKSGQITQAVQELSAASKKSFEDFSDEFVRNTREAYQVAGYSEADAATAASVALPLPHLPQLKELSQHIAGLAQKYRESGNPRGAQSMIQMGLDLGQRLETGKGPMTRDLVGIAIQRQLLASLDPAAPYGAAGQTVQSQLDALAHKRDSLQALARQQENVVSVLPDEEVVNYFQQVTTTGEIAAARWAVNKFPAK